MLNPGADATDLPTAERFEVQKLRDLRTEINAAYRADARSEALRETIAQSIQALPPMVVEPAMCLCDPADKSLVVCVADCHYGAEWAITGLHDEIVNAYSPEVFEQRMETLLAEVLRIMEREDIWNVTLLLCGDSLDGMLRASQLMKLRWGIVESAMRYAEYMAQWIARLGEMASVRVYSVDGNHTEVRPLGSKRGEFENENMERIITWYLAERFRDTPAVTIDMPTKAMKVLDVQGFSFLLSHDTDTKTMEAAAKQAMLLYGEKVDFMVCGHKHREAEAISGYTDSGSALVVRVPSVCGADRYAQRLGFGGKPGALVMVMERGYGRRCVYPVGV